MKIIYVDFGNTDKKRFEDIYELDEELYKYPFQAVECKLAEIKPDLIANPVGVWTRKSTNKFRELIDISNPQCRFNKIQIKIVDVEDDRVVVCHVHGRNRVTNIVEDIADVLVEPDDNGLAVAARTTQADQLMGVVRSSLNMYPTPILTSSAPPAGNTGSNRYYVPNRESGYMSRRADFAKIDAELKRFPNSRKTVKK